MLKDVPGRYSGITPLAPLQSGFGYSGYFGRLSSGRFLGLIRGDCSKSMRNRAVGRRSEGLDEDLLHLVT